MFPVTWLKQLRSGTHVTYPVERMKDPVWFVKPKGEPAYPVDPRTIGRIPQSRDYVIMEPHPAVLEYPVSFRA